MYVYTEAKFLFFSFDFGGQTYKCMILQLNIISDVWTDAVVDRV